MLKTIKILFVLCIIISCNDSKTPIKLASINLAKVKAEETEDIESVKYNEADSIADTKIKKYKIRLIEGKNKKGGYTKVKYLNTLQLINMNNEKAKKQLWDDKIIKEKISYLKNNNTGGRLELIIIRSNIDSANLKNFAVIIKDLNEKELFKKELPSTVAQPSRINKHMWNSQKIDIPIKIRPPFYVYVQDISSEKPFKFSVVAR